MSSCWRRIKQIQFHNVIDSEVMSILCEVGKGMDFQRGGDLRGKGISGGCVIVLYCRGPADCEESITDSGYTKHKSRYRGNFGKGNIFTKW